MTTLVLVPPPQEVPGDGPGGSVRYRRLPAALEEALAAVAGEACDRVVLIHPAPLNVFALLRRLATRDQLRVGLVSQARPELCFWTERCGGEWFPDLAAALAAGGSGS